MGQFTLRFVLLGALTAVAAAGCAEPLDTTRVAPQRGTLGAEIYKVFCQRMASTEVPTDLSGSTTLALCEGRAAPETGPTARLRALASNRARLVDALDRTFATNVQDDLRAFLLQLLPLYDPPLEILPGQTRATAELLARLAADPEVTAALERFGSRAGYRPLRLALGVIRPILAYPQFDDFASKALDVLGDGGAASDAWTQLLRTAALEMATSEPSAPPTPGEQTTLALTRSLLFRGDDTFARGDARWVVQRDVRGLALPTRIATPFYDGDGDGLADLDASGRFVGADGRVVLVSTPFAVRGEASSVLRDPAGRALAADGTRLWTYFDANRTLLAGTSRELAPWFDPRTPTLLDAAYGLPALLGPPSDRTERYGMTTLAFRGPTTQQGAVFDVVHGAAQVLHRPETEDALQLVEVLLRDREDAVAGLIDAAWYADDRGAMYPNARLEQPNVLWDRLLEVVEAMSRETGMMEAVLRATQDSRTADLGEISAQFMRYRDRISFDPANVNAPVPGGALTMSVDRSAPDTFDNESLFQQSLAVIHDLDGVRVCNKEGARLSLGGINIPGTYAECQLLRIDNVAEAYELSVLGRYRLELCPAPPPGATYSRCALNGLVQFANAIGLGGVINGVLAGGSGINGLTQTPTPQALARLVFAPRNEFLRNLLDDPKTRDGVSIEDRHCLGRPAGNRTTPCPHAVIFAWEKPIQLRDGRRVSFLQALTPLLTALADHDPAGGRLYFGSLISALHLSWPSRQAARTQRTSPTAPFYAEQANGRAYEQVVADLFDEGRLFVRLKTFADVADQTEIRAGVDGHDVLAAATEVLVDPTRSCRGNCAMGSLRYRDGRDHICWNDGTCFDGSGGRAKRYPSPIYLVLDGLSAMDRAWTANPARHTRWLAARGVIAEQLLRTRRMTDAQFTNRRGRAILLAVLPFLRERIAAHRMAGDSVTWAQGLASDAEDAIGSPLVAALLNFLDAVQEDPEARDALSQLGGYLVNEASQNDAFDATLFSAVDALQVLDDDRNIVPFLRALSTGLAPNVRTVVASGGQVAVEGSATDETLTVLREVDARDPQHVLRKVLANLVSLPATGEPITPLETLADALSEVSRVEPNAGTSLRAPDYSAVMNDARDFLQSEERGLERLYDVVQNRSLAP